MKIKWLAFLLVMMGLSTLGLALADEEGPVVLDAKDQPAIEKALGKSAVITGKVSQAAWSKSGKVMAINFEGNDKFSGAVFDRLRKKMDESFGGDAARTLTGAEVRITGKIEKYGGKVKALEDTFQVIINQTTQLTIITPATQPAGGGAPTTQSGN